MDFRPQLIIPELQTLMMHEANDLSDSSPQVYVVDREQSGRDDNREKAFQAAWQQAQVTFHIMMADLWALFCGTGVLQVGFDPMARNGQGFTWVKARNPKTVHFDPATDYEQNWSYLIFEDWLYLEDIRQRWPHTSKGLRPRMAKSTSTPMLTNANSYGFQMPSGPMATTGGINSPQQIMSDNRLRVRYAFCLDYTRELAADNIIPKGALTSAGIRWKYPNGRMIVECEGQVLADGDNPFPLKRFPLVLRWATPPLFSAWSIPATRYTQQMQSFAERLYTGVFENAVRLNNGVWFIDERTGIDPNDFGGLPGEVRVINANSPTPQCVFPNAMPAHVVQTPKMLLDMQRTIQGFTPQRSGQPGDGNISPELFDESVLRAQGLTQLRGRLGAYSTQKLAELMFYTMARFQRKLTLPYADPQTGMSLVNWTNIERPDQFDLYLDPASIQPMSQAILRRMAPELAKFGVIPTETLLQWLSVPHADDIAKKNSIQRSLEALANARRGKR